MYFHVLRRTGLKRGELLFNKFLESHKNFSEIGIIFDALNKNLEIADLGPPQPNAYLVASSIPGEGKTMIVTHLAIAMALAQKKVLIIDADFRRSSLHKIFGISNESGLIDLMLGTLKEQEVTRKIHFDFGDQNEPECLTVIPSGLVSPHQLRTLDRLSAEKVLNDLKKSYDFVLIDSPPITAGSDALILAPLVQGIILVLNTGVVSEREALEAKEQLERAGGRLLGVVMNRFNEKLHGHGLHHYYGYYQGTH